MLRWVVQTAGWHPAQPWRATALEPRRGRAWRESMRAIVGFRSKRGCGRELGIRGGAKVPCRVVKLTGASTRSGHGDQAWYVLVPRRPVPVVSGIQGGVIGSASNWNRLHPATEQHDARQGSFWLSTVDGPLSSPESITVGMLPCARPPQVRARMTAGAFVWISAHMAPESSSTSWVSLYQWQAGNAGKSCPRVGGGERGTSYSVCRSASCRTPWQQERKPGNESDSKPAACGRWSTIWLQKLPSRFPFMTCHLDQTNLRTGRRASSADL